MATALGLSRVRGKVRRAILAVLGLVAFLTYFNFGSFHFPNFIHGWDTFHYYIGTKYSRELSYDRLYECVAVADSELPALRRRVELRKLTNLRTNILETTADILAHPERCKQHFTPERWQSFHHDLAYFRTLENARRWDDAQTDHGYNGTPVWNIAGSLLANLAPASKTQNLHPEFAGFCLLDRRVSDDCVGVRLACAGGGALGLCHQLPLALLLDRGCVLALGLAVLDDRERVSAQEAAPLAAGLALAYSTLLRMFPIFLFVAPVLAAVYHIVRHRELPPVYTRFFVGAALGAALLDSGGHGGGRARRRLPGIRTQHDEALGDSADQQHGLAHGGGVPAFGGRAQDASDGADRSLGGDGNRRGWTVSDGRSRCTLSRRPPSWCYWGLPCARPSLGLPWRCRRPSFLLGWS